MLQKVKAPIVFAYHDYREFLEDMMNHHKNIDKGFNGKVLAQRLDVSASFLSMMFKGKRDLSPTLLAPIGEIFGLVGNEQTFFELLVNFNTSKGDITKARFLERMNKFKKYKEMNPQEARLHKYMSSWINVAIREMTALEGFQDDPKWIQAKLRFPVNLNEVKKSLDFLIEEEIIKKNAEGKYEKPEAQISCVDKVYTNSLTQFHRGFLKLAGDSTIYANTEERRLFGHCVSLEEENKQKAMDILNEAFEKIRSLQTNNNSGKDVFSIEMALFPLTTGE